LKIKKRLIRWKASFFEFFLKGLGLVLGIAAGIVIVFIGLMIFVLIQALIEGRLF
jgi:hypothetical protein